MIDHIDFSPKIPVYEFGLQEPVGYFDDHSLHITAWKCYYCGSCDIDMNRMHCEKCGGERRND